MGIEKRRHRPMRLGRVLEDVTKEIIKKSKERGAEEEEKQALKNMEFLSGNT